MSKEVEQKARSVRQELRSIHRQIGALRGPLSQFQIAVSQSHNGPMFYVEFGAKAHRLVKGVLIQSREVNLPDEHILDAVSALAMSLWHLKDHVKRWTRVVDAAWDVEIEVAQSDALLICADLANRKKHAENKNRSGRDPRIELVHLDTSQSGVVELWYDGAGKDKELLVSEPVPIPYRVPIVDGAGTVIDQSALNVFAAGIRTWKVILTRWRFLDATDRETQRVRELLDELSNPAQ